MRQKNKNKNKNKNENLPFIAGTLIVSGTGKQGGWASEKEEDGKGRWGEMRGGGKKLKTFSLCLLRNARPESRALPFVIPVPRITKLHLRNHTHCQCLRNHKWRCT